MHYFLFTVEMQNLLIFLVCVRRSTMFGAAPRIRINFLHHTIEFTFSPNALSIMDDSPITLNILLSYTPIQRPNHLIATRNGYFFSE